MITDEQREALGLLDERKDFYFKVENAVIDNEDVFDNIYESMIYITLSRFCNGGQVAFPSISTLAKKCYCSESSIKRNLKTLIDKKLIKKVNRKKAGTESKDTNLYAIVNINEYSVSPKVGSDRSKGRFSENQVVGSDRSKGRFSENQVVGSDRSKGRFSQTYKEELIKEEQIKEQQTKKEEVVVDESLLKKAEEEAKKNPSVKNPEIYAKGMVENGWKPEEPKMNPKFDTKGPNFIDTTDPKVISEYFENKETLEISPEEEEKALNILKVQGSINHILAMKNNKKLYINTLRQVLASA